MIIRRRIQLVLLGLAACIAVAWGATAGSSAFDPGRYLDHIKYLASPEMRGRATGSPPELEKAAQYISDEFRRDGLSPPDGKSYLQPFEVTTHAQLGPANHFDFSVGADTETLQVVKEFIPFNFSARRRASGGVVFAGYGITAPYGYDDYAGIDVYGRFVVVLAHEPQEYDEKSIFAGRVYTDHAQYYTKALNARQHGAAGVILIIDRFHHRTAPDELQLFGFTAGPADAGIPFFRLKRT